MDKNCNMITTPFFVYFLFVLFWFYYFVFVYGHVSEYIIFSDNFPFYLQFIYNFFLKYCFCVLPFLFIFFIIIIII